MTDDKGILIKNIYYMLTYAFQVLKQTNYDDIASEDFDKTEDLFAEILSHGIAKQLKHGLYREYVIHQEIKIRFSVNGYCHVSLTSFRRTTFTTKF